MNRIKLHLQLVIFLIVGLAMSTVCSGQSDDELIFDRAAVPSSFLIQTNDNQNLSDQLEDSMKAISQPFGQVVIGANTLIAAKAKSPSDAIPLATIYQLNKSTLTKAFSMGNLFIKLGSAPLHFKIADHRWIGPSMESEFVSSISAFNAKFELVRKICVDHHGYAFIKLRLYANNTKAKDLLKTEKLSYQLKNIDSNNTSWRIWCRTPDGSLIRPDTMQSAIECDAAIKRSKGFLIVVVPESSTCEQQMELENQICKSNPISSINSAMNRWLGRSLPGLDSPEPWLNKLWAAQAFAITNQLQIDPETENIIFKIDSDDDLRYIYDIRWLCDNSIGWRTLYTASGAKTKMKISKQTSSLLASASIAMFNVHPYPKLQKIVECNAKCPTTAKIKSDSSATPSLTSYAELIEWSQSLFVSDDFRWPTHIAVSSDGERIKTEVPIGVIDTVITKLAGVKAEGSDCLKIEPAKWISNWPYFAIDNLPYRGHNLSIVWQSPGRSKRYPNMDVGFSIFVDGILVKHTGRLKPMEVELK